MEVVWKLGDSVYKNIVYIQKSVVEKKASRKWGEVFSEYGTTHLAESHITQWHGPLGMRNAFSPPRAKKKNGTCTVQRSIN